MAQATQEHLHTDHQAHCTPGAVSYSGAASSRIRLILMDSYGLSRASLARLLKSETDLDVVGDCATAAETLEILARETVNGASIDLIVLDFDVGAECGTEFISAARRAGYSGQFLIVADSPDTRNSALALKLGASGIFLKSDSPDRLVQAIRLVNDGGVWVDRKFIQLLANQLIERYPRPDSDRPTAALEALEQQVLLGIVEGRTNRQIGDTIGVSESKVKNVVQRLFGRAGVKTRGQLVRAALEGSL
jgi:DNA-binding NarL/FixJ family response regulator